MFLLVIYMNNTSVLNVRAETINYFMQIRCTFYASHDIDASLTPSLGKKRSDFAHRITKC